MNFGNGVKKPGHPVNLFLVPKGLCYGVDLSVSETETQRRIRAEARHFTTKKNQAYAFVELLLHVTIQAK